MFATVTCAATVLLALLVSFCSLWIDTYHHGSFFMVCLQCDCFIILSFNNVL